MNYNLSVGDKVIKSWTTSNVDDVVAIPKDMAKIGQLFSVRCIHLNKEYQGIKLDFVGQKQSFSQVVPMPYMPKINVELRAKKDNTLINGMEITACNARE